MRYVRLDDGVHIAYQVFGTGPSDLLVFRPTMHLEVMWEHPWVAEFYVLKGVPGEWALHEVVT